MEYKIINNPDYTNCVKVGIQLVPDCECLRLFFSSLDIRLFPIYINKVIDRESFGSNEFTFIQFYDKMYKEDIEELKIKGFVETMKQALMLLKMSSKLRR